MKKHWSTQVTAEGLVVSARDVNRRYTLLKTPESVILSFTRPAVAGDRDLSPHVTTNGRVTTTRIKLSHKAMAMVVAMWNTTHPQKVILDETLSQSS